jgi:quercetin dioxygenase-like cupin family protein
MLEPILLTLDPGGSTYPDNPHEGEEFGYVLNGSITLHIGNKTFKAKKGESFYYKAGKKHFITASEKQGATLLWISTPPNF